MSVKKGDIVLAFEKGPVEDELRDLANQLAVKEAMRRKVAESLAKERIDLELKVRGEVMRVERAQLDVVVGVNLISRLELEKAKLDLKQAKLQHRLALKALQSFAAKRKAALDVVRLEEAGIRHQVEEKKRQLVEMDLRAPANGVIYGPYTRANWVRTKILPGVVARSGDKLLEIPDLSAFNVAAYVRQRDAGLLRLGDQVKVYPTLMPNHELQGKVTKKDNIATTRNERMGTKTADGNLKEIKVTIELREASQLLRPGGTARADVSTVLAKEVLLVPLAALTEAGYGYEVTMADGSVRSVKVGRTSTSHAEIISGLKEGDKVAVGTKPVATGVEPTQPPGSSNK
jgi:multidrug resistance efflux pump